MYALSKSLLNYISEYKIEVYSMEMLNCNATVFIELKILKDNPNPSYVADYEITREDGKAHSGTVLNYPTKEATIEAIQDAVIKVIEDEDAYWE